MSDVPVRVGIVAYMAPWRNRQNASDLKSDSTNDWSVGSTPTGATTKQRWTESMTVLY